MLLLWARNLLEVTNRPTVIDLQPERELTKEVLDLAEFGLQALEHYNRQEALSSVGMQF